jgi:pimeloyl-ACP methyl ester carboxylesterase
MPSVTRRGLLRLAAGTAAMVAAGVAWAAPEPIDEEGFASIGGIDQWVAIRGKDRSRPAILFLHGGPCDAQSPHLSLFAPWEERYVVAQWDQRGSGKTFDKNGSSTPDVTFERIARDSVEVAQHVLARLGRRKLILVGHSWGALLGLQAARLRPELFYALVGTGQPVSAKDIVDRMQSSAIARAQAADDGSAVAELKRTSEEELMDDPNKFVNLLVKWTEPFIAADQAYLHTPSAFPNNFCEAKLNPSLLVVDARTGGYHLPVPYFVIQGRDDNRTLPNEAKAFFERVHAPVKEYTAIDGGHFAFATNPTGFLNALDSDLHRLGMSQ